MPAKKYATTEQVDKMHDCLDKFKTETKINFARVDERLKNVEKSLDDYRNESKDARAKVYAEIRKIAETLAADHAVDEYKERSAKALPPASSNGFLIPLLEAIQKRARLLFGIIGTAALIAACVIFLQNVPESIKDLINF